MECASFTNLKPYAKHSLKIEGHPSLGPKKNNTKNLGPFLISSYSPVFPLPLTSFRSLLHILLQLRWKKEVFTSNSSNSQALLQTINSKISLYCRSRRRMKNAGPVQIRNRIKLQYTPKTLYTTPGKMFYRHNPSLCTVSLSIILGEQLINFRALNIHLLTNKKQVEENELILHRGCSIG